MFIQELVSFEEAFNQISSALAINGYAISKQGDTMIVKSARNIQRDLIEVSWIGEEHWNKGYCTEAMKEVVQEGYLKRELLKGNKFCDIVVYGLLKENWKP